MLNNNVLTRFAHRSYDHTLALSRVLLALVTTIAAMLAAPEEAGMAFVYSQAQLLVMLYLVWSAGFLFATARQPSYARKLRLLNIVVDLVVLALVMILAGYYAAWLYPVYPLYTRVLGKYLPERQALAASGLALLSFAAVFLLSSFWNSIPLLGGSLLVLIILSALRTKPLPAARNDATPEKPTATETAGIETAIAAPEATPDNTQVIASATEPCQLMIISRDTLDSFRLQQYLGEWSVVFTQCQHSADAFYQLLRAAESGCPYDTVIVDNDNLDLNNVQFATAFRGDSRIADIQLILMAPGAMLQQRDKLRRLGYTNFIATPIERTLLYSLLNPLSGDDTVPEENVVSLLDRYEVKQRSDSRDSVLIACNDLSLARTLQREVARCGHRAMIVGNGDEALKALAGNSFDLAILDQHMKRSEGLKVTRVFRMTEQNPEPMPIFLIAENADEAFIARAEDAGVVGVLPLPVNLHYFRELVSSVERNDDPSTDDTTVFAAHAADSAAQPKLDRQLLDNLNDASENPDFFLALMNNFIQETDSAIIGLNNAVRLEHHAEFLQASRMLNHAAATVGATEVCQLTSAAEGYDETMFEQFGASFVDEITHALTEAKSELVNYLEALQSRQ